MTYDNIVVIAMVLP